MNRCTKVAVHGLIKKGNKYLLTKRSATDNYMPKYWDIPGGTIEFGEDISKALKRELKEEVGIKVEIKDIVFAYNFISNKVRHQYMLVYECSFLTGEPKLSADHSEYCWLTISEMKKLKLISFVKALVKNL